MVAHICDRCSKTLASRQSLWNHRQRCKANAIKERFLNEQIKKPESTQEKFLADIVNRANDQHTTSILPMKLMNPKTADSKSEEKSDFESDSDSESIVSNLDHNSENMAISDDGKLSSLEELKAKFRTLYKKVHTNIENLVLILDELHRVNCLTEEECNVIKMEVQKKINVA